MSKEKQIEEMARVVDEIFKSELGVNFNDDILAKIAERLYDADCRKQSEWISVEERLPKELTHVIICDEDGTVGEAFCYKEGRFEWIDSEEIAFVTHWMPLPEAPKMKGGAE
jgi:hypothetical protein